MGRGLGVGGELADSPFIEWGRIRKDQVNYIILPSHICLSLKDIAKQLPNLFIIRAILQ